LSPRLLRFGFCLPLSEEIACPRDLGIGMDIGEAPTLLAHLRGERQDIGFKLRKVRVVAQIGDPFAHCVDFGRQGEHAGPVGAMCNVVGAHDVLHRDPEIAVGILEIEDPDRRRHEGQHQRQNKRDPQLQDRARLGKPVGAEVCRHRQPRHRADADGAVMPNADAAAAAIRNSDSA